MVNEKTYYTTRETYEIITDKKNKWSCEGGSANIYKCVDSNGNIFAIKVLKEFNSSERKRKRFEREVKKQSEINHSNIVPIIDWDDINSEISFYVMPFYKSNLRSMMCNLDDENKIMAFIDICNGVSEIHRNNLVHRDLKPENVLYDAENNKYLIADFGIVHDGYDNMTKSTDRLANFDYHAPEQKKKSAEEVGAYTDIFSLGLILNELFTGKNS